MLEIFKRKKKKEEIEKIFNEKYTRLKKRVNNKFENFERRMKKISSEVLFIKMELERLKNKKRGGKK